MRRLIAALACAACACLPAHALASGHTDDVGATRAYLRADDVYERSEYAEIGVTVAAIEARASQIGGECASALTYAPRDAAFEELGDEAYTTAFFAGAAPALPRLLRLAHAIEHLSWSDKRLTRLVRAEAAEERAIATLALPKVCADIAAWKANDYAAVAQSTARFLARVQAIESLSVAGSSEELRETVIMRLLRRFETPIQRRIAERIERLEVQIGKRFGMAEASAEKKLAAALGVATL